MKDLKTIFITGITGYIGGTIAVKLKERDYRIIGLVRKPEDAKILSELGYEIAQGTLQDHETLSEILKNVDAVIHTADSDNSEVADFFIQQLKNTGKTLIYTSGSSIVANWDAPATAKFVYTEDFPLENDNSQRHRVVINRNILRSAIEGVRSVVIVPSMVYGQGLLLNKHSKQLPILIHTAKEKRTAVYVKDGSQSWSNVHVEDLAELYILALEKSPSGTLFFAENGIASFKEIAESIHTKLCFEGEPKTLTVNEASQIWGEMMATVALGSDCRMSAEKARKLLDWKPKYNSVLEWIEAK